MRDPNVSGIRLNSAMLSNPELDKELEVIRELGVLDQLYFDVKARQPRVVEVIPNRRYLDLRLNHPVEVRCPSTVLFKGGVDQAVLDHLEEDGRRLIFKGGPEYAVKPGESLYLRDPNLRIKGDLFIPEEIRKIEKCRAAGFKKWFLSYVEEESDIDQFLELAGQDAEVWLKIESMRGLQFVAERFKKRENLVLVAARGDLYVEIDRPDQMAKALRLIIEKDPEACAASRLLLSVVEKAGGTTQSLIDAAFLHLLVAGHYHHILARLDATACHTAHADAPHKTGIVQRGNLQLQRGIAVTHGFGNVFQYSIKQRAHIRGGFGQVRHGKAIQRRGIHHRKIQLLIGRAQLIEQIKSMIHHPIRSSAGSVYLVDYHDRMQAERQCLARYKAGLRHRPFHRIYQQQHTVHHRQYAFDFAAKIGVSRCVNNIDMHAFVLNRTILCQNGNAALFFQIIIIHYALGNMLVRSKSGGLSQQLIHEGGFAVVNVGDNGDVTDCARHDLLPAMIQRARILAHQP